MNALNAVWIFFIENWDQYLKVTSFKNYKFKFLKFKQKFFKFLITIKFSDFVKDQIFKVIKKIKNKNY